MYKFVLILLLLTAHQVKALPNGSGTCLIDMNFNSITGMGSRFKNFNNDTNPYTISLNLTHYSPGVSVEITISGPAFIGIIFTFVNEANQNVGIFEINDNSVHACTNADPTNPPIATVTHTSSFGSKTNYTLFWIPPEDNVGTVYLLGYLLKGVSGNSTTQEFFRYVRNETSTISIISDVVLKNGFE